jgi:sugar lactone lactonase YvrE
MNRQRLGAYVSLSIFALVPLIGVNAHPPSGIVVNERGVVYFQDGLKGVWKIADGGQRSLYHPLAWHWMSIDPTGKFANAPEQFGEWFARVSPRGQTPALIICSDFPCAMGRDGNLYFAHMHSLKIMRRTPDGTETVLVEPQQFRVEANRPYGVTGLTCGPDGKLYLFLLADDSGTHAVYSVDMDGSIRQFAANFVTEKIPESERHPEAMPEYCRGLTVDGKGNVFIAVTGNRCVMKLTPSGQSTTILRCDKPWTPTGVAEHDGNIFVLEYDDETPTEGREWPPRVRQVAPDETVSVVAQVER